MFRYTHTNGRRAEREEAYRGNTSASERIQTEHQEVRHHPKLRSEEALQGQHEALSSLSEVEFHMGVLLAEQR